MTATTPTGCFTSAPAAAPTPSPRALNGGGISNFATLNIQNGSAIGGVGAGNRAVGGSGGVYNYAGTTTVDASTVISNTATNNGGGIWNQVTLTVQNGSTIVGAGVGNQANSGGGIYNYAGTTTVDGSTVISNTVNDDGGGIYNEDNGTVAITNSTFSHNEAGDDGGGISNWLTGTVTVTNSTLSHNETVNDGGGIYNRNDGTVAITNSTLSHNEAGDDGGGIHNRNNGTVAITNSTLSGNEASGNGGGIFNLSTANLTHVTITGNTADSDGDDFGDGGGGIDHFGGSTTLKNTIVAGNFDTPGNAGPGTIHPDISSDVTGDATNLIGDTTGGTGTAGTGSDIVDPAPGLGPLADNGGDTQTHALLAGSPAIDAVTDCTDLSSNPVTTDQRGVARPQGSACDIGAYEAANCIYLPIILKGI